MKNLKSCHYCCRNHFQGQVGLPYGRVISWFFHSTYNRRKRWRYLGYQVEALERILNCRVASKQGFFEVDTCTWFHTEVSTCIPSVLQWWWFPSLVSIYVIVMYMYIYTPYPVACTRVKEIGLSSELSYMPRWCIYKRGALIRTAMVSLDMYRILPKISPLRK